MAAKNESSGEGLIMEHFKRDGKHASDEKCTKNYQSILWNYGQQNRRPKRLSSLVLEVDRTSTTWNEI